MDISAGMNIVKATNKVSLDSNRSRNDAIINTRRSIEKNTQRYNTASSQRLNTETGAFDGGRDTDLQTYVNKDSQRISINIKNSAP